jgi:serine protease Do
MSFISKPKIRRTAPAAVGALVAASIIWSPLAQADTDHPAIADLVDKTAPAVVTVLSEPEQSDTQFKRGNSPFEEFFRQFGFPRGMPFPQTPAPDQHQVSLGSGFLITADGYIVTNNHVVENSGKVTVKLADERELKAKVIGTDAQSDVALLKVSVEDAPHLNLGDSGRLRVGEDVIAVGNPFGLGGTVTRGIVSALGRDIHAGPYVDFIQTDAAINHGNSGGPLLNLSGEVVGVNSAIYSPNGGSVGVGFAIPSNTVETVVTQLKDHGSVERGWLGVSIQNVTPDIAKAMHLDQPNGALVAQVVDGSPSAGKLKSGDVIVNFDGKAIESSRDLPKVVAATRPGSDVDVKVIRNGHEQDVSLSLGKLDADKLASAETGSQGSSSSEKLGAQLAALDPDTRAQLGLEGNIQGVVVTALRGDGPAAEAGLRVGDVILQVSGKQVRTSKDVDKALADASSEVVLLQIDRDNSLLFVGVPIA